MRSFLPLVELTTWAPDSTWPEYTRMKVSWPKNGWAAILNAKAENGSSAEGLRVSSFSSSFGS